MAMKKTDFLALAGTIKSHNQNPAVEPFTPAQVELLADFCQSQNPDFKRDRWLQDVLGC
jgi:hypothetical protein